MKAELTVIGGGAAGLSAALRALQLGADRVVVLEQRPYTGGNAGMAGGTLFGAETALQKAAGNPLTVEDAVGEILRHHRYERVNGGLIRALVQKTPFLLEWLAGLGTEYTASPDSSEHLLACRAKDFGGFRRTMKEMETAVLALGGQIFTQAQALAVERQGEVFAVQERGQTIHSRAVLIATGGFLGKPDLMAEYFPAFDGPKLMTDAIRHTGGGVFLAEGAGAKRAAWCTLNAHGMHSFDRSFRYPNKLGQEAPVWVNRLGRRFVAEASSASGKNELGNAVYHQPGQVCFALFDQKELRRICAGQHATPQLRRVDLSTLPKVLEEEARRRAWVCRSEDWDEIARWIGVPPDDLRQTLKNYHEACAKGRDPDFGKEARFLTPLVDPPFVAVRCVPIAIETYGPIEVNQRLNVLGQDGREIPGLYAAGAVASGWQGADYYPRGSSLGFSLAGGLLAAEHICRFLL